jgi:hypothetical protein
MLYMRLCAARLARALLPDEALADWLAALRPAMRHRRCCTPGWRGSPLGLEGSGKAKFRRASE